MQKIISYTSLLLLLSTSRCKATKRAYPFSNQLNNQIKNLEDGEDREPARKKRKITPGKASLSIAKKNILKDFFNHEIDSTREKMLEKLPQLYHDFSENEYAEVYQHVKKIIKNEPCSCCNRDDNANSMLCKDKLSWAVIKKCNKFIASIRPYRFPNVKHSYRCYAIHDQFINKSYELINQGFDPNIIFDDLEEKDNTSPQTTLLIHMLNNFHGDYCDPIIDYEDSLKKLIEYKQTDVNLTPIKQMTPLEVILNSIVALQGDEEQSKKDEDHDAWEIRFEDTIEIANLLLKKGAHCAVEVEQAQLLFKPPTLYQYFKSKRSLDFIDTDSLMCLQKLKKNLEANNKLNCAKFEETKQVFTKNINIPTNLIILIVSYATGFLN